MNIQTQLQEISDKLIQMDSKLNQMTEDFNFRAVKANQMISAWHLTESISCR